MRVIGAVGEQGRGDQAKALTCKPDVRARYFVCSCVFEQRALEVMRRKGR